MDAEKSDLEVWAKLILDWQQAHDQLMLIQSENNLKLLTYLVTGGNTPYPTLATMEVLAELSAEEAKRRSDMDEFVMKKLI